MFLRYNLVKEEESESNVVKRVEKDTTIKTLNTEDGMLNGDDIEDGINADAPLSTYETAILTPNDDYADFSNYYNSLEIYALAGDDEVIGTNYGDIIYGNEGRDIIRAGAGDDILFGGEDHDILLGEAGNDVLNGGEGNDIMIGGDGDDLFISGLGSDAFSGGDGYDTLNYASSESGIIANFSALNGGFGMYLLDINGDIINISYQVESYSGTGEGNDFFGNAIEHIIGTNHDDVFNLGSLDNLLETGKGNDIVRIADFGGSNGGDNEVFTGDGDDIVLISTATELSTVHNYVELGNGDDLFYHFSSDSSAEVHGGDGNDAISLLSDGGSSAYGGAGDDVFFKVRGGFNSENFFFGGDGDDTFNIDYSGIFDPSHSVMDGGSGNDVFIFDYKEGWGARSATIDNFEKGSDLIDFSKITSEGNNSDLLGGFDDLNIAYDEVNNITTIEFQNYRINAGGTHIDTDIIIMTNYNNDLNSISADDFIF